MNDLASRSIDGKDEVRNMHLDPIHGDSTNLVSNILNPCTWKGIEKIMHQGGELMNHCERLSQFL